MFQSRFNHHPYPLGVFFRFLSPLELAKLSCRHRRTDLARTDVMSENLPKSMSNRKVHCNLSNQYHRIIIYIYICLFMSLLSWGTKCGTDSNCLLRKVWRFSTAKACGWSERCLGRRRLGGFPHRAGSGDHQISCRLERVQLWLRSVGQDHRGFPLARREIAESADTFRGRISWNGLGLDHLDLWSMWDFVGRSQGSRLSKVTNDLLGWHHIN